MSQERFATFQVREPTEENGKDEQVRLGEEDEGIDFENEDLAEVI